MVTLGGPHVLLAIIAGSYIICGAWIFQNLEAKHYDTKVEEYTNDIQTQETEMLNFAWNLTKQPNMTQEKFEDILMESWAEMVNKTFDLHYHMGIIGTNAVQGLLTSNQSQMATNETDQFSYSGTTWDLWGCVFFTTTMLLSIGYGMLTPLTTLGRAFCVVYCLIGIPLTLVAIANMAKFLSEIMYFLHFKWVQFRLRLGNSFQLKLQRMKGAKAEELERILASSRTENDSIARVLDCEEDYLESLQLVQFPPLPLFVLMLVYAVLGAYIMAAYEKWTHVEAIYFSFVSILTIGFGDLVPRNRDYLFASLAYIIVGVILTTTCIDIVGSRYLEDMHNFGRRIKNSDPLAYVRKMKMRSRKKAMASLLAHMAQSMVMRRLSDPKAPHDGSAMKKKKRKRRRKSCNSTQLLLGRAPPDPPMDCQVLSTSAYSVRLAWAPSYSQYQVHYNVKCRLKHIKNPPTIEMSGLEECHCEIKGLVSCSLYEFIITAYNMFGPSQPVYLVQYSEPELSPQHITMERLGPFTMRLHWELPFKRWKRAKEYIVYFTEFSEDPFDKWNKKYTQERWALFATLDRDKIYYFCVCTVFDDGLLSPLSRSLPFKTENPDRLTGLGQSQSIAVMENITERNILPPLPREFVSTNTIVLNTANTQDSIDDCCYSIDT